MAKQAKTRDQAQNELDCAMRSINSQLRNLAVLGVPALPEGHVKNRVIQKEGPTGASYEANIVLVTPSFDLVEIGSGPIRSYQNAAKVLGQLVSVYRLLETEERNKTPLQLEEESPEE